MSIPVCRYCGRIVGFPGATCLPCLDAAVAPLFQERPEVERALQEVAEEARVAADSDRDVGLLIAQAGEDEAKE